MTVFIYKKLKYKHVNQLRLNNIGEWELELKNKKRFDVELNGECIVTHFLIWLNFSVINTAEKKKIFHVLLLPDSLDKDLLRQLRVRLRFLSRASKDKKLSLR
jgi:hypothetical protein